MAKKNRNSYQAYAEILETCTETSSITKVVSVTRRSHQKAVYDLNYLGSCGLISLEVDGPVLSYTTTEAGKYAIKIFRKMERMFSWEDG